jgi:hypothetical protein
MKMMNQNPVPVHTEKFMTCVAYIRPGNYSQHIRKKVKKITCDCTYNQNTNVGKVLQLKCKYTVMFHICFTQLRANLIWYALYVSGILKRCSPVCQYLVQHLFILCVPYGVRGSVVGWGTMLQAGRSRNRIPMRWIFLIYIILPTSLWPWCRLSL